MKLKKPKFWDSKSLSFYSIILSPIAILIQLISRISIEKKNYSDKIIKICVGNIYIGGTGKTSLSLKINKMLKNKGIRTCFIKKYYKNQIDERDLLSSSGYLISTENRKDSLLKAINKKFKVAIFDDGLQDKSIDYDKKFVCFNNINWIGNGKTIPSGPLRENINSLKKYDDVVLNGNLENLNTIKKNLKKINSKLNIHVGEYIPVNIKRFQTKNKYIVFSGIGNHATFIEMLLKHKIRIAKDFEFPDHYNYNLDDINKIIKLSKELNCNILTTEKDFKRLKNKTRYKFGIVKVDLKIQNEKKLLNRILN